MMSVVFVIAVLAVGGTTAQQAEGGQWVSVVKNFSSQASTTSYSAKQVLGVPDVYPTYGVNVRAWIQQVFDANQFLELQFATPVYVTKVDVYEIYNAGGVKAIKCLDVSGTWITLWSTPKVSVIQSARIFSPSFTSKVPCFSNQIRLDIDCSVAKGYVMIDAVRLHGSEVKAECLSGPVVKITIPNSSNATLGYTVYSVGTGCPSTTVTSLPFTYIMDARVSGCTFKLGTAFNMVVQKYAEFATVDDRVYAVTCKVDLIPQVLSASVNTTMLDQTSAVSDTFNTTVTFAVVNERGAPLSTVRVGQDVKLLVRIPVADNAAVGFTIRTVKFQVGSVSAVTIISAGCPVGGAPINAPVKTDIESGGVQNVPFKMFVPVSISNRSAPSSTIAAVSIEVEVTLCNGNCTAVTCTTASGRKRRSSDTDVLKLTRPLVILPPSMSDVNETVCYKDRSEAQQIPTIPTALIATAVGLGLVLTLCIVVLVIMFCRLRRHGDARDSKKPSFENKAYN